ncbi:alpha/beta hydrolase-fold protein [Clostridium tagluense]|uniref:alpha/beta hydrolase-fold protein n=1 Tax=Clostridium tagluense TaxID=360422 RepID=UPI001C6DE93A|nr:alpha/beta hydrolase-fold protein [Clostridium tagluense]MBW9157921.1 DUF3327 domain-containing protein [Clostridium tagluense]WLC66169.1 DUF3327 domain-containing protein [Clostridium tagluense]
MGKSLLKSKMIMELNEKIQQGNNQAMEEFLCEIKSNGAPLVERIDGDSENSLVTYVYKQHEDIENILLIHIDEFENYLENKMERLVGTDLWYKTYKMNNELRFSYKFSVNDALDDDFEKRASNLEYDKLNKNKLVFKDSEGIVDRIDSYVIMPSAKEQFWIKERNDTSKGVLYKHKYHSKKLDNYRSVWVYTPFGYTQENTEYGFLLLTDGDAYINVLSATTVLDKLIVDKKIPPIVTIFVDSNDDRYKELTCNDTFVDFLTEEIVPWVRDNYAISCKPEQAIIGGSSLGGLTATYVGLKKCEVFGNVLSQSGSYWYKPEGSKEDNWLSSKFREIDKLPLKFYLNVGVLEHKDMMIDTNITLRDTLRDKGYTVQFEEFKSGHDYLSWGETLANGLISLIGTK